MIPTEGRASERGRDTNYKESGRPRALRLTSVGWHTTGIGIRSVTALGFTPNPPKG